MKWYVLTMDGGVLGTFADKWHAAQYALNVGALPRRSIRAGLYVYQSDGGATYYVANAKQAANEGFITKPRKDFNAAR